MIWYSVCKNQYFQLLGSISLLVAILLTGVLYYNGGDLIYILDDPYIHLRLAENIIHGHYGLNPQEFASPVSSVLWPFLLTPFIKLESSHVVPLFINFISCLLTACVMQRTLRYTYSKYAPILTFFSLFCLGGIGVIFTGMEHSLQLLLAVIIVSAAIDITEERKVNKCLLMVALVIAPLIRYELLSISLGAVILFCYHNKYEYLIATIVSLAIVSGFSYFLWLNTGEILPASVLAKTNILNDGYNMIATVGVAILLITQSVSFRKDPSRAALYVYMLLVTIGHLLFGKCGSFSRYEVYVNVSAVLVVLYYLPVSNIAKHLRKPFDLAVAITFLCFFFAIYITSTLSVPAASHAIYSQQVQMRRLADQSGFSSVAVNDIGYMSFRNSVHVVDLWGVSNYEQHKRYINADGAALDVASKENVPLVMIYPRWFQFHKIPEGWFKMGSLEFQPFPTLLTRVIETEVDVYATNDRHALVLKPIISNWQKDLPQYAVWKQSD